MSKKYLCPRHKEDTPSANAYSDGYHCFGCGARGPLSELGLPADERIDVVYKEDIEASVRAITDLPKQEIRGFQLHADDRGYYLLWPDLSYYKRRILGAESGNKYRGPSGHTKPWFKADKKERATLALVEGEFNALSLAALELSLDVVSPGGAGDFYSRTGKDELRKLLNYRTVNIIVDNDAAGAQAAIESKSFLVANGHNDVRIHLVEKDFNDVHTEQGLGVLRGQIERMELCSSL